MTDGVQVRTTATVAAVEAGSTIFTANDTVSFILYPIFVGILTLSTIVVFSKSALDSCTQPLGSWCLCYMGRTITRFVLQTWKQLRQRNGLPPSPSLVLWLTLLDLASLTIWSSGGYYIFHTDSCDPTLWTFSAVLWGLQSLSLLIPCCIISLIICCLPCLMWALPYIIPPNPNATSTNAELISKIPRFSWGALQLNQAVEEGGGGEGSHLHAPVSCAICLADYGEADTVMRLPCRGAHLFHAECGERWLAVSQLCPICRSNISDIVESTHAPPADPPAGS